MKAGMKRRVDSDGRVFDPASSMNVPASLRKLAWLALLVIAPGVAGPGAIVATLAVIASFEHGHAHHVSVQADVGHDDFVICHDAREATTRSEVAFAPADCADDHRLHAANAESLISRHEVANVPIDAPLALVARPLAALAPLMLQSFAASDSAMLVANRHDRTVVLRV
jgi:hypothetical protein